MRKEEVKNYLIICFVVVELLSMLFNFYFFNVTVGMTEYKVNFSIIFFCLGFFIVDIVADQFSPEEANKFIYYKLVSQMLFLILGNLVIQAYGLQGSQLASILNKSPWVIVAGLAATYMGFYVMNAIMSHMKLGVYQGTSIFNRYLCSTLPGELLFSLVFTGLCFYKYNSLDDLVHLFLTSAVVKILLSVVFAFCMSMISRFTFFESSREKSLVNVEAN